MDFGMVANRPRTLQAGCVRGPWVERFASRVVALGFPQRFVLEGLDEESQSNYLSPACDEMRIEITDDGCGFDPRAVESGHGLGNTRERCAMMEAEISLTSSLGNGTRFILDFLRGLRWSKL